MQEKIFVVTGDVEGAGWGGREPLDESVTMSEGKRCDLGRGMALRSHSAGSGGSMGDRQNACQRQCTRFVGSQWSGLMGEEESSVTPILWLHR